MLMTNYAHLNLLTDLKFSFQNYIDWENNCRVAPRSFNGAIDIFSAVNDYNNFIKFCINTCFNRLLRSLSKALV